MTILQRYALKEILSPLGLGLLVFTFIFLIGQLFRIVELLLGSSVPRGLVLELIGSLIPAILSYTAPIALLVSILLGFGRLSADREILAIRTSGVNLFHICVPVLGLAALMTALMLLAAQNYVPFLNLKTKDLALQMQFKLVSSIPPNRPFQMQDDEKQNSVFLFEERDPATNDMVKVQIQTTIQEAPSKQRLEWEAQRKILDRKLEKSRVEDERIALRAEIEKLRKIEPPLSVREILAVANRGHISVDEKDRFLRLELTSGSIHIADKADKGEYFSVSFASLSQGMQKDINRTDQGIFEKSWREMSTKELRSIKGNPAGRDRDRRMSATELYKRHSVPFACLAFSLIAIPLAIHVRPTGKAVALALSFALIFIYYGLLNYGESLGKNGSPWTPVAIFLPNILLSVVGGGMLWRMVRK